LGLFFAVYFLQLSQRLGFMQFYVYILYSLQLDQYYIGHTHDKDSRLFRHNHSGSRSTKKANDWKMVHAEYFLTRSEAMKRESEIKRKKSRKFIKILIDEIG
jgi:putative endonuclease